MAVLKVSNRSVYIVTGQISQTVNFCRESNLRSDYEYILRLPISQKVTADDLARFQLVEEAITWLVSNRSAEVERSPSLDAACDSLGGDLKPEPPVVTTDNEASWIERARRLTELSIDELLLEFLDMPYLHRVEHSVHTRLCAILGGHPHFDRHLSLAGGLSLTQAIHKEWPETIPRPEKNNRRGNFDIAILSPARISRANAEEFCSGRIIAPIVIEMGLNYDEGHLAGDVEKLLNSKVEFGYVVHLLRDKKEDLLLEETIHSLDPNGTIRVGFASVFGGHKRVKLLSEKEIHEV